MFLRIIRSLDKTLNLTKPRFSRFLSQISPNINDSQTQIPSTINNNKPLSISTDLSSSSLKFSVLKRAPRKKPSWKSTTIENQREETFNVCAYATADWYDLEQLKNQFTALKNSFQIIPISDMFSDVICIDIPKTNTTTTTSSQAFIFDDGAVVFWNVEQNDENIILKQVTNFSDNQYPQSLIENEKELIKFTHVTTASTLNNDIIKLNCSSQTEQLLDKYTFSNALALSVKLGIWEALLDDEVEFVADLANRLKQGKHIKIEHGLMQKKSGELYSLKHAVNLSHDFLDIPDFYWSNSRLENLYKKVFNYFTIAKRTKVLNERLNFALELISVIEASLNEKKHVRLEWIIIILICAEVFFNIIDHLDFFIPDFPSKKPRKPSDN